LHRTHGRDEIKLVRRAVVVGAALACLALPAAALAKGHRYEYCGGTRGCGFVLTLNPHPETWRLEPAGETGTYGREGIALVFFTAGEACVYEATKGKKRVKYSGAEFCKNSEGKYEMVEKFLLKRI
jgi:hypothetical protein